MQFVLYRTVLAAPRLSPVFEISRAGQMTSRGMKSKADGKSANSKNNLIDNEPMWSEDAFKEEFPSLSATTLSVSKNNRRLRVDMDTSHDRKTENKEQNIVPLQRAAIPNNTASLSSSSRKKYSLSSKQLFHQTYYKHGEAKRNMFSPGTTVDEQNTEEVQNIRPLQLEASTSTCLPTSFGKKRLLPSSRKLKLRQAYCERGEAKRNSSLSPGTAKDEPFDICPTEIRKSNSLKSSAGDKNSGNWVSKVQLDEEDKQQIDNMEKDDDMEYSDEESGPILRPGMVLLRRYLPISEQVEIVNKCRELGLGTGGFYRPGFDDGAKLRLYMMCLGLDWNAQTKQYAGIRGHDNVVPPHIPDEFTSLVSRVIDDSHTLIKRDMETTVNAEDILPAMSPDVCIVNFYNTNGRLGLHQDRDESRESLLKRLPVVSISVGDSAEFLYGDQRDIDKAKNVLLKSGDVLIFGGGSRHVFHGVKTILPNTAPRFLLEKTNLRPGRLNLTFRKY